MPFFTWNSTYSVGVREMDTQHKAMMEIINRLHDAMLAGKASTEVGKIITEMVDYAQYHFVMEEKLLSSNAYPNFSSQKTNHEGFTKKVKELQNQFDLGKLALSIEVLTFQKDWWTKHIQGEDKKYSSFLNEKGVI